VVIATSQWKLTKVNLQQLINIPISEAFDIDYSTSVEPPTKILDDIGTVFSQSMDFQPIIRSYAFKTRSFNYTLRASRGAYYPQLVLKGSIFTDYYNTAKQTSITYTNTLQNIGFLQNDPSQFVSGYVSTPVNHANNYPFASQLSDNLNGTFSLGVTIPILNYLKVRNSVKLQKVNLSNARLSEELVKVTLRKTLEQVYVNAQNSAAQYQSANEEVIANKAAYDISVVKYKEGKMIATDLILLKNGYIKAQSDLLQAKYALLFNYRILDYYRGVPITF
jgi:outer membrane protein